ncbi:MAG TPA: site-2 protease family protein [Firmicutes bacterium]|uniref:Site-2 protease family protein n=1 Tax=Candidatus Fermentithermobacillus carboniphilus TaxID=3085328 RepID=A0AAT9LGC9_9FIRM|nr:MAG: site-2 protease family protein [Candidatus Fermentithermobacillus carboniphilus]HHW17960.1 site-2 protease family protein [Candidatus Fermentithermobacillaceae bacterium]
MTRSLLQIILKVPGFLLAISVHEYAHARMAYRLGDDTAEAAGRMTLEPWAHIDIIGAMMLILFGFGWARPVPVNAYRLRNPRKDMAKVALAGPLANLVTAFFLEILTILLFTKFRFRSPLVYLPTILDLGAWINAGLAIFNLIPVPPLDGSRILEVYLPPSLQGLWDEFERYGFIILVVFLVLGLITRFMAPLLSAYMSFVESVGVRLSLFFWGL